jgi:hypothetical protein
VAGDTVFSSSKTDIEQPGFCFDGKTGSRAGIFLPENEFDNVETLVFGDGVGNRLYLLLKDLSGSQYCLSSVLCSISGDFGRVFLKQSVPMETASSSETVRIGSSRFSLVSRRELVLDNLLDGNGTHSISS